jgi:hypothetical protein
LFSCYEFLLGQIERELLPGRRSWLATSLDWIAKRFRRGSLQKLPAIEGSLRDIDRRAFAKSLVRFSGRGSTARDKHFLTPEFWFQFVRDPFPGGRDQVFVSAQDSMSLDAPRFVKSIQEDHKDVVVSCCGNVIYIERRFCRCLSWSNEIALLMMHACSSCLWLGAANASRMTLFPKSFGAYRGTFSRPVNWFAWWADGAPYRTGDEKRKQDVGGGVRLGPKVHFIFRLFVL